MKITPSGVADATDGFEGELFEIMAVGSVDVASVDGDWIERPERARVGRF